MKLRKAFGSICYIGLILFTYFVWRFEPYFVKQEELSSALETVSKDTAQESGSSEVISDYKKAFPDLYAWEDEEVSVVTESKKPVYLTFDDGPSKNTGKILDILKEYDVKATFFVIGKDLTEEGIANLKRAVEEGHAIGMHTYCHDYNKIYASVSDFLADYDLLRQELEEILGYSPTMFRFPGGSYCSYGKNIRKELIEEMTRRGYTYYDWNVSAEDAVGTVTAYSIRKNIFPKVYEVSSPVILMHDAPLNSLTVEVLPEIIKTLQEEGFCFETLETREPLHFGE